MHTTTFDTFREAFVNIQRDVMRDYGTENGRIEPICHVMHRDLSLGQTPAADAEELVEALREAGLEDAVDPADLDFTDEHHKLHKFLDNLVHQATALGLSPTQTVALVFVIARRYGMREAAAAFDTLSDEG